MSDRRCTTHHHACDFREERFRAIEAERDALKRENKGLREALWEAVRALDDLSFACFGGIGTRAPSVDTYNRTFAALLRVRHFVADKEEGNG